MTDSWANFGADLHLDLSPGRGRRAGLVEALREAARSGRLAPGTRLPSSRSLAVDLGMARNTVADAYAELVAEGVFLEQLERPRGGAGPRARRRATGTPGGPGRARPRRAGAGG
ncbi:GntR family transcriptional regulator, partial [Streptomyces goshikiensis]